MYEKYFNKLRVQPATFIILPFAFYTNMSYTFHGIKTLFQECDWM